MGKIPFVLATGTAGVVVGASSTASYSWNVGSGEKFEGFKFSLTSTSASLFLRLRDSNGNYYSNDYINAATVNRTNGIYISLPFRVQLTPNMTLTLELQDTSGSQNTVHVAIIGYKELGYTPAPTK